MTTDQCAPPLAPTELTQQSAPPGSHDNKRSTPLTSPTRDGANSATPTQGPPPTLKTPTGECNPRKTQLKPTHRPDYQHSS